MKKLTYEYCKEVAKKYSTLKDFRTESESVYVTSLRNKWLKDYTWLKTGVGGLVKWNEATVREEALKYEFLKDFVKNSAGAYDKARKMGWLKNYTWLKQNTYNKNEHIWYVYVYEIENKYVYIGLTVDLDRRDYEHRKKIKRDSLAKFCYKNNIILERKSYIVIAENLTAKESQEMEDRLKNEYFESEKWAVINSGKTGVNTGSLGSGVQKWDKEACYNAAKQCKTRKEFCKKFSRAYNVSNKNNWMDNYTWFKKETFI